MFVKRIGNTKHLFLIRCLLVTIYRRNLYKQQSKRKGIQQPLQEFEVVLRDVLAA